MQWNCYCIALNGFNLSSLFSVHLPAFVFQVYKDEFFFFAFQMYTNDWEDQAMSSLFHLICSLYKVGLSAYSYKALNDGRKKVFSYTLVCVLFQGGKPPACTGAMRKLDRSFC